MKGTDDPAAKGPVGAADARSVRLEAERRMAAIETSEREPSGEEARSLVHELRVHQIELELQNEELRRTRDELEASREKYFDLYDLAPVGYATLSREGMILEANLTLANRLGVTRGALIGRPLSRFVHRASADVYLLHLRRLFETGEPESIEVGMATEGSTPIWARIDTVVHEDERSGTRSCRVALTDVTDRKSAEAALFAAHKLEALGVLAGGIAHDFNNILYAIRGNTAQATSDLPADHPVRRYVLEIDKAAKRAAGLVEQILSFASPNEASSSVVQLGPVIDDALKLLRATVPASIDFKTEWAKALPPVAIDPGRVHQVVVNLITNAAHAIGRQKGRIDLRLEDVISNELKAPLAPGLRPGRFVLLTIRDDGCGMDQATLDRAFDPFFTTKLVGSGTGLGLSVVHGIMKGLSGAVSVSSEPTRGTTFRLYFPVAEGPPSAAG